MIFREFFTDGEILLYSTMAQSIIAVRDKESFDAFVLEVEETLLKELSPEKAARIFVLGLLMGAYMVQQAAEQARQAGNN